MSDLNTIARTLVAPHKGLLAADESEQTIAKRFADIGIASTEESRRQYRQMLFTTPGIEEFLSGIILFDETIRQKTDNNTPLPRLLADKGIIPGIKVDTGTEPFAPGSDERITQGLDGLAERLVEYRALGAKFTKWRAVITMARARPTAECIAANAEALANYAEIAQDQGFVPIIEPEVLMDGNHSIDEHQSVTRDLLTAVFAALGKWNISLSGLLLKTNMALPGKEATAQVSAQVVADKTLEMLRAAVPDEMPGIVFLSGGQTPEQATARLAAISAQATDVPWKISFSFSRALQNAALGIWAGNSNNINKAQEAFYGRLQLVSKARDGQVFARADN